MVDNNNHTELLSLNTKIMAGHAGSNKLGASDIPLLIGSVFDALRTVRPGSRWTSVGQDRATSCRKALDAAQEFCRRTEAENAQRRSTGALQMAHGLALHVGEVA